MVVPDHFHVEAAGAIRRLLIRGLIDDVRAATALDRLLSLPVTVSRSEPLIADAWSFRHSLIVDVSPGRRICRSMCSTSPQPTER